LYKRPDIDLNKLTEEMLDELQPDEDETEDSGNEQET
jgi:hypothetical protein